MGARAVLAALLAAVSMGQGSPAATPANVCTLLANRRYVVIDVRSPADYATANICGTYETKNLPANTLNSNNIEASILALNNSIDNTGWTPTGPQLGISKDRRRFVRYVNGIEVNATSQGTPFLVYGGNNNQAAAVATLITNAGFLGGVTNIGRYSVIAARNCACPQTVCQLLANANNKILDTRRGSPGVDCPGSNICGYSAATRLCARTANLDRGTPWTNATVEAAIGADKTATILTLCWRGNWADDAYLELQARGYTNAINIGGYESLSKLRCRTVGNVPQRGVTCPNNVFRTLQTYNIPTSAPGSPAASNGLTMAAAIALAVFAYVL